MRAGIAGSWDRFWDRLYTRLVDEKGKQRKRAELAETFQRMHAEQQVVLLEAGEVDDPPLVFTYRNHRGEVAERRAYPLRFRFGSSRWHPEPQWLLLAYDCDRKDHREFAVKDIAAFS